MLIRLNQVKVNEFVVDAEESALQSRRRCENIERIAHGYNCPDVVRHLIFAMLALKLVLSRSAYIAQNMVAAETETRHVHFAFTRLGRRPIPLLSVLNNLVKVALLAEIHEAQIFFIARRIVARNDDVITGPYTRTSQLLYVCVT